MGLSDHAQKVIDDQIETLWNAYRAGYDAGRGEYPKFSHSFHDWLKSEHPMLALYYDEEKLK